MPAISKELVDAMKYFVPTSRWKYELRLNKPFRTCGGPRDTFIADMPHLIVRQHTWAGVEFATVCGISSNPMSGELGYDYPNWRTSKFATEIKPEWLGRSARVVYDYCCDNDLRPGFNRIARAFNVFDHCNLLIRWQREHLNRLLDLHSNPLFDASGKYKPLEPPAPPSEPPCACGPDVDIAELAKRSAEAAANRKTSAKALADEYEKCLDELADDVATQYVDRAIKALCEAANQGESEAKIFAGGGEGLITHHTWDEDGNPQPLTDYRMFANRVCWDAMVARGLCRWAASKGWNYRIETGPAYNWCRLHVPFDQKVA